MNSKKEVNFVDDEKYTIRYSELSDEAFLKGELSDEDTRKWYPPSTDSDVNIFVRNWAGFARYKCSLTASYDDEIIGVATIFLMPYVKVAHLAMMYVVVKKEFRGRGVGVSLIRNINHLAKTKFKLESLHVEVFDGSNIESVLKKCNYRQVFKQNNFVEIDKKLISRKVFEVDLGGE